MMATAKTRPDVASLRQAAQAIRQAEHLLITAGAGMGVDSGLPDFRGGEGFWNAYPPYRDLGLDLIDVANPEVFVSDPALAWGFYGHRLQLYRETVPHAGFQILRRWAESKKSHFMLTSNVDGHFQKAGFHPNAIFELHGSIHHFQCITPCTEDIWSADNFTFVLDPITMRAQKPLPRCPHCRAIARPNVILFGDYTCAETRHRGQAARYMDWLRNVENAPLVVVELGAGGQIPTIRYLGEQLATNHNVQLLRINPTEPEVPEGGIGLRMGASEALQQLARMVGQRSREGNGQPGGGR